MTENFKLLRNVPNLVNISSSVLHGISLPENSMQRVYAILKLHENRINHISKKTIFDIIKSESKRQIFQVVTLDKYLLPITYNSATKSILINLKPFDVSEISQIDPRNLFSSLVYGYTFYRLINKKSFIKPVYSGPIINFLLAVLIRVFGKYYGLIGVYSTAIPKLKFLLACYILSSFFNLKNKKEIYRTAASMSAFNYQEDIQQLNKYDFSNISDFIKSLSVMQVMPGIDQYAFTAKLLKLLSLNFLPAIEDISRFVSTLVTSSVPGTNIVPTFLFRYNENEFNRIVTLIKTMIF